MLRQNCTSIAVLLALTVHLRAATPELNLVLPRGAVRGSELVINLQGARLADAQQLFLYQPGIQVIKLEVANPGHVKATIKIADDCLLGEHALRVRCRTGTSTMRTFWVGALPCLDEVEPNSEFAKPQSIPMNSTVHGVITPEDVDYFAVDGKKGQRLAIEVEGMRLGTAFFDPAIAILDERRFELASSDDTPQLRQDSFCAVQLPADGKYIIRVRESAYGGSPASYYRLHVGSFPRPSAVFPLGGKIGEETTFTFLGDPLGDIQAKTQLAPSTDRDQCNLHPKDANGICPSPLPVRANDLSNIIEAEPNDAPAQATAGKLPCALNGVIQRGADHDYYRFTAKKGEVYDFRCYARKLGSPLDAVIWISHPDGRMIVANDDNEGSPDAFVRFTVPEDKEFVIGIRDHLYRGGPQFVYRIEAAPVEPRLAVLVTKYGLPPTQERQTIDVPQGNRYAALVQVARRDIGGDNELGVIGLPDKVTAKLVPVPAGLSTIPMVFEAAADAPIAGRLGALTVVPAAKHVTAKTRFYQGTEFVFGQNNVTYAQTEVDRLAMAVTEPVPLSIQLVEPKAPLVRNGVLQLRVVAERREGHKAPINLVPLFTPPGVAGNNVAIPEGQTEVVMTLTANGGAGIGKWPFVVMAQTTVKDGPAWVSSQMGTIDVAAQPLTIAFEKTAAEQGKELALRGTVAVATPFDGSAKVKLFGLPNKVNAAEIDVSAAAKDVAIPLTIDATSPPGQHRNIICQVTLMKDGEPVIYTAGVGELRIDRPPPPKANQAPVAAKPPEKQADKPLSRLEQLRKSQQDKEKGGR